MGVKRQQGSADQLDLFDQAGVAAPRRNRRRRNRTWCVPGATSARGVERQRALTQHLIRPSSARPSPSLRTIANFLMKCGVSERNAWLLALSGKGWWRLSGSQLAGAAMTLRWFAKQGLVSLQAHHAALQHAGNRRVR
jgi:hypothetical protein